MGGVRMPWLELAAGYRANTIAISVTVPCHFSQELYGAAHYADYWAMASNGITVSATLHVSARQAEQWVDKVVKPFLYWGRLKFAGIRVVGG
jgi:hypothetical protein